MSGPAGAGIVPSLEEATALAGRYTLVPLRLELVDDVETPVSAFLKLRALAPGEPAFLLESAEQGQRFGRYSFIGLSPRQVLTWSLGDPGDPYELAEEMAGRWRQAPAEGLPPFTGGLVGYFGYDLVRTVEPLGDPNPDALGLPDMALMVSDLLVAFDHLRHTISVIVNLFVEPDTDLPTAYAEAAQTIEGVRQALAGPIPESEGRVLEAPGFESNMSRAQFEGIVGRIVEYVHAGDAFQVVPSQRWSAETEVDPFSVYRGLRVVNPSPYMYFLDFGEFQVVGASPEPLLTVSGREASTRPIAGTRPRGTGPAEDQAIADELLADEKERAEHVMLVDLGRNDLGRVCEDGSVHVDGFMEVENYSHVMHIVSSVSGRLRDDVSPMDALRSILPAGTLSGAPKVRAMQIIDELEPVKRGGYGGAIGYLSYAGDLDTCIHIRTVVFRDGQVHVQAGGGTVADARPENEYEESVNKARAVMRAIEMACAEPGWR